MVTFKSGVCCACQSVVPLTRSEIPLQQELARGWDREMCEMEYGDSIHYICVSHEFYGEPCEGTGQIPQCVLKD